MPATNPWQWRAPAVTFRLRAVHILVEAMKRLISAVLAAGLLTACAGVTAPGASRSTTPRQALADSGKAMSQLKSARFDLSGSLHVTLPQALVDQLRSKAGSQGALLSSDMTIQLQASGAAEKSDQLQATISAKLGGLTLNTEVRSVGGKLYYKDPMTAAWKMVKSPAQAESKKPSSSNLSYQALLDNAKSITEVDSSSINGVAVDHYRVVPDLVALFARLSAGHASDNSAAISALQSVLQNATVSADVWSGTSDHLVRKLTYKADVTADLSQLAAAMKSKGATPNAPALTLPAGSTVHLTLDMTLNLHDFNSQVKVQAPAVP